MSESSMDSLLWSDDDCSQDVDVTTNPDEEAEESDFEIVRCICEVKEENDFMIQVKVQVLLLREVVKLEESMKVFNSWFVTCWGLVFVFCFRKMQIYKKKKPGTLPRFRKYAF